MRGMSIQIFDNQGVEGDENVKVRVGLLILEKPTVASAARPDPLPPANFTVVLVRRSPSARPSLHLVRRRVTS